MTQKMFAQMTSQLTSKIKDESLRMAKKFERWVGQTDKNLGHWKNVRRELRKREQREEREVEKVKTEKQ